MSRKRILITGMSGLIGGVVRRHLEQNYLLRALNRRPIEDVDCHCADISDFEAILPAFQGIDVVIHLAAFIQGDATWENTLNYNVAGTYNVFEAARQSGVQRIIYASSGATVAGWEKDAVYQPLVSGQYDKASENWTRVNHESPIRPSGLYGCSKVWGEALARHFSDDYDISVICLRIGHVVKENHPKTPRDYSVWCSQRDIAQMVSRCIEAAEDVKFDIFYAVSDNKWGYRDLEHARTVIGYIPQDAAEDYR